MLNITVKTLDSRNYQLAASEDWTVLQFKEHISSTVNAPSNEQRLIFCGRVLQDDKKLTDYDCNGKVIHLVRRPPPDENPNQGGSSADSNNNSSRNSSFEPPRDTSEGNILFSAMTLGHEAIMNSIIRQNLSYHQALHSVTLSDGRVLEPTSMSEIDRYLHNTARLSRLAGGAIHECMTRLNSLNPTAATTPHERSGLRAPVSLITTTSSHSDLQRDSDMQSNNSEATRLAGSSLAPQATVDDMEIGGSESHPRRTNRSAGTGQSLTTDDLPSSETHRLPMGATLNTGQRTSTRTALAYNQSALERYRSILNHLNEFQNLVQGLAGRYRQLIDMSMRGGLIVTGQPAGTESDASSELERARDTNSSGQTRSVLLTEARVIGQHLPRIMHHLSHLEHALSNFSVDFARGRLVLCAGDRRAPRARRTGGPPGSSRAPSEQASNQSSDERVDDGAASDSPQSLRRIAPAIEGSVTITATTVETSPIITATSSVQPTHSAVIQWSTEPTMILPLTITPHIRPATDREASRSTDQSTSNNSNSAEDNQQSAHQPNIGSSTTEPRASQSAPNRQGVVSSINRLLPIPFDYHLPCVSPWANYSFAARREGPPATARIQLRALRPQSNSAPTQVSTQRPETQSSNSAPQVGSNSDIGLTEVVSNLVGSMFRNQPRDSNQQPQQQPQQQSNQPVSPLNSRLAPNDPLLNIIPELALNAASQILNGVLGMTTSQSTTGSNTSRGSTNLQQQQQQQNSSSSTNNVMMDIDIDDSSSSQSESRYQDAAESHSPAATLVVRQTERMQTSDRLAAAQAGSSRSSLTQTRTPDHGQIMEMMRSHPEWVPIIEADITAMQQQQPVSASHQPFFSDAYLSSIPRKRRRLLRANPERVLILQPSPSQAISNLLRRAIASSNTSITNPMEQVLDDVSADVELQQAYEEYIKSAVETRLRSDYDYCPEKFENSSKYFK